MTKLTCEKQVLMKQGLIFCNKINSLLSNYNLQHCACNGPACFPSLFFIFFLFSILSSLAVSFTNKQIKKACLNNIDLCNTSELGFVC